VWNPKKQISEKLIVEKWLPEAEESSGVETEGRLPTHCKVTIDRRKEV
jgi:hypothetical protein